MITIVEVPLLTFEAQVCVVDGAGAPVPDAIVRFRCLKPPANAGGQAVLNAEQQATADDTGVALVTLIEGADYSARAGISAAIVFTASASNSTGGVPTLIYA